MSAVDHFHVGVVVDDFEASLKQLTDSFGYTWCPEIALQTAVVFPDGEGVLDLRLTYSATVPRVEIIQSMPGTLWLPVPGSGLHHMGYWSDDVATDASRLVGCGYEEEVRGVRPDGTLVWTYHRHPGGFRVELVSRVVQDGMEQYWASS